MQLTALASAFLAIAGNTPNLVSIPAMSVPEPMWLALWGVALIGFSSTLRARTRPTSQPEPLAATASSLDAMQPSVARSI